MVHSSLSGPVSEFTVTCGRRREVGLGDADPQLAATVAKITAAMVQTTKAAGHDRPFERSIP